MALHVMTENCKDNAEIRKSSDLQYHLGVMMMVLGIDKLTEATLPEFHARLEFYQRLSHFMQPDEAEAFWRYAQEAVGVRINSVPEKQAAWIKRMATERFREIVYEQKRAVERAQDESQLSLAV